MKKSKFTEEQIAFALRQADSGTRVAEVCRKMGISEQSYYSWRKELGGTRWTMLNTLGNWTSKTIPAEIGIRGFSPVGPHLHCFSCIYRS